MSTDPRSTTSKQVFTAEFSKVISSDPPTLVDSVMDRFLDKENRKGPSGKLHAIPRIVDIEIVS